MTQCRIVIRWSTRAVAWALACAIGGCSGSSAAPARPEPGSPAAAGGRPGGPAGAPASSAAAQPTARGEPAPACDFRVGESCFATDTEACAAAGCRQGSCIVLESYPAQVTCK